MWCRSPGHCGIIRLLVVLCFATGWEYFEGFGFQRNWVSWFSYSWLGFSYKDAFLWIILVLFTQNLGLWCSLPLIFLFLLYLIELFFHIDRPLYVLKDSLSSESLSQWQGLVWALFVFESGIYLHSVLLSAWCIRRVAWLKKQRVTVFLYHTVATTRMCARVPHWVNHKTCGWACCPLLFPFLSCCHYYYS